jgi:hypothetical protein
LEVSVVRLIYSYGFISSIVVAPFAMAAAPCKPGSSASTALLRASRSGNVLAIETPNFTIRGLRRDADARAWAEAFEALRSRLVRTWLGDSPMTIWSPKCEVVLHGSLAGYRNVVGTEAERTLGSTCVSFEDGNIVRRLVDVRANQRGWFDGAVPHELTHVLLAEYLDQAHFPAWADEGMAIQADPVAKRQGHHDDLQVALRRGTTLGVATLFVQPECPAGNAQTFCGESASLVQFFTRQGAPDQFVRFLRLAASDGYDGALRQFYGIAGTSDLERRWHADLASPGRKGAELELAIAGQ